MRVSVLTGYILSAAVALATLIGCGGSQPVGAPGVTPQARAHADRGKSWMLPEAKSIKRLLYLSDSGADVFVYDYDSFEKVGTLTGLDTAAEECVNAKGDVWIVEDSGGDQGGGNAVEYGHGDTTQLNEVATNQPPGSCSVSPDGDLEITDGGILQQSGYFGPGEVQIWKSASGTAVDYAAISNCLFLSSGGYDNKGNLYVIGTSKEGTAGICELPAGAKALIPVAVDKSITNATGIMWDGKYMAVTNSDDYVTMIFQTQERRNGKALSVVGSTTLADSCFGDEVYISPPPFIVGKRNTPVNTTQGTAVAGFNFICGINPSKFRTWAYPAGGSPVREASVPDAGGEAVSIAPSH
ncbi:MAG TPA: hypothetical protein VKR56_11440 [Candidatus Cybelea sp.]|nr:hypothetical protein [Candidatus Cybelea sp.]